MIEVDIIKKHGKKALGLAEHAHEARGWRARLGEILLEIGIIVFAISLSIWLHSWQEHRHDRARERQFLLGLQRDLAEDLREMREDSAALAWQKQGLRYFRKLTARRPNDSVRYYSATLTATNYFTPNDTRFQGLKSSGGLGIVENEELLQQLLNYYERTTTSLTSNGRGYAEYHRQTTGPYLDLHLRPDQSNLLAVLREGPMQNYLARGEVIASILAQYSHAGQEARALRQRLAAALAGE
ncbi:hypothetical protein [Hymenobacter sp.]|uniref:hypothetical protein n=1 Tax=Hymenobacter sp. TaxID=1898978 RepID=UPI00286B52E3|nr:hypothetical protein [Hymenobacter sp.]